MQTHYKHKKEIRKVMKTHSTICTENNLIYHKLHHCENIDPYFNRPYVI